MLENFEGKILDSGDSLIGLHYAKFNVNNNFKTYNIKDDSAGVYDSKLIPISLYGKSLNDFLNVAKEYNLKYIAINKKSDISRNYPYLVDVYDNQDDYPFFNPIITSESLDFKKLEIKIYEIDYTQLDEFK